MIKPFILFHWLEQKCLLTSNAVNEQALMKEQPRTLSYTFSKQNEKTANPAKTYVQKIYEHEKIFTYTKLPP